MKKILCVALMLTMLAGVFTFVGCDETAREAATVMTVSLNPEVEFVLDGKDRVITVNALNEEGNLIVSAEEFENVEGKTAEEAAKLFVEVSVKTGYVVTGRVQAGENNVEFAFSCDAEAAQKLFESVRSAVTDYLSKTAQEVVLVCQQAQAITKAQLEELVAECAPYLEEAEIKAMEYKQLLAEIVASRKETAEYYSQELKQAYYEAKAHALDQAKYEVLKTHLSSLQQTLFDASNAVYTAAVKSLEDVRFANLVSEDSAYQQALAAVRQRKTEYLNYRNEVAQMEQTAITTVVLLELDRLKAALEVAESTLLEAGKSASALIDGTKQALDAAHDAIVKFFSGMDVDAVVDEIAQKQTETMNALFTSFETKCASAKQAAEQAWNTMDEALRAGYSE